MRGGANTDYFLVLQMRAKVGSDITRPIVLAKLHLVFMGGSPFP